MGRRIKLAVGVGFALVLLVGGISVLLAWTISRGVERGRLHGREVEAIDRIHSLIHHFVGDAYLDLQGGGGHGHPPPEELLRAMETEVVAYEALERAQGGGEAREELTRLDELKSLLARLEAVWSAAKEASARGQRPTGAQLALLNQLAHEQATGIIDGLHALHRRKFDRAIAESRQRLLLISGFYAAFAMGGVLLLFLGDRFLSRTLVLPITRLAQAALRIAGGDLSHRVPARSGDEVGQLSQAFNLMAERLEIHEAERASFQAELERQVKERTRELEETAARLRATQAELLRSERIAVTGQIAAGVTHEVRTPLNSLAINVQLLRRELSRGASLAPRREILNTLATVEYEITRINRALEEFVNFARRPAPCFEPVEVGVLLQEVLELLGPQAAEAGVRVETPRGVSMAPVRGDRDQLREVFLNLGQNALQAMPNGGVLGVEVSQDGEGMEIAVTDTGPGVPEAERERIFLPFVSTKADGLGLGLAIVRRIVEEHGGSVSCQNRPGRGAVFTVRLPAAGPGREG
ncbi:MAG: HAMP domain-containing protein [Candidatus Rokubacteria bacterium]|nr:HAMP domain-containing protein [Candidatus Rokubacteria bacterium]